MAELAIDVAGIRVEPYAAVPTIVWSLRLRESTGARVHTIALHTQVRIEAQRRLYDEAERGRLLAMFGEADQWSESLRPFQWTTFDTLVPGFEGEITVEVPMACTYDFEVAGSRYMHSLERGEVPLVLLFSGTVFTKGGAGLSVGLVPWHLEARHLMPVALWRETMQRYFPGSGWLRLEQATIDRLQRYRAEQAFATCEAAITALLKAAGEDT
ncbi:MAG: DUF6084 family protein [Acidimicrobiales bacterium]